MLRMERECIVLEILRNFHSEGHFNGEWMRKKKKKISISKWFCSARSDWSKHNRRLGFQGDQLTRPSSFVPEKLITLETASFWIYIRMFYEWKSRFSHSIVFTQINRNFLFVCSLRTRVVVSLHIDAEYVRVFYEFITCSIAQWMGREEVGKWIAGSTTMWSVLHLFNCDFGICWCLMWVCVCREMSGVNPEFVFIDMFA